MAWTSPRTWVTGEVVTSALLNTHVRDNFNATAVAVVTTKGDIAVATASVTLTRLAVGTNSDFLVADSAASMGVRWTSTAKTASAGLLIGANYSGTLTAAANNDGMYVFRVAPVIGKSTFTGLTVYGLVAQGDGMTATGTGTISACYALYATPPIIGTVNAVAYFTSGLVGIGDDRNANMTTGLTINQGAADDEILALKSSDVAHGVTDIAETDTYGYLIKAHVTSGGLDVRGLSSGNIALRCVAIVTTEDTTKAVNSVGATEMFNYVKSGTTVASMGANANLLVIGSGAIAEFIFDADGESHENVGTAWINFDEHDDIALLNLLAAKVTRKDDPVRRNFGKWLKENRNILEELKLVTFNRDGNHFINRSRTQNLLIGAMRQVGAKLEAQAERILQLEKKVLQLSA